MSKPQTPPRELPIDVLKLLAAQLIVLHHFSSYGPLAQAIAELAPHLSDWLFNEARKSVQIFLVVGGYLAARSLAPQGRLNAGSNLRRIINRYLRLALPYLAALGLTLLCGYWVRSVVHEPFVTPAPTADQLFAHVFLLQGLLGFEALFAGAWYVAIDFQLFVLMIALLWLGSHTPRLTPILVICAMLASLFFFNLDPQWDNWAIYFFGSYGLGAAAFWLGRARHALLGFGMLVLTVTAALSLQFRDRIALALTIAVFLGTAQHWTLPDSFNRTVEPVINRLQALGRSSYALLLLHFAVLMLCNALFALLQATSVLTTPAGIVVFLIASLLACTTLALIFERLVERPLNSRFRI